MRATTKAGSTEQEGRAAEVRPASAMTRDSAFLIFISFLYRELRTAVFLKRTGGALNQRSVVETSTLLGCSISCRTFGRLALVKTEVSDQIKHKALLLQFSERAAALTAAIEGAANNAK